MRIAAVKNNAPLKPTALFLTLLLLLLTAAPPLPAARDPLAAAIKEAGNTDSDSERLEILRTLRKDSSLPAAFKADLDRLIPPIERWVNDKNLPWFGRDVSRKVDFDFGIAEDSPLQPLTWLYRGRMVLWYAIESGSVSANPRRRKQFSDVARTFFRKYAEAFPENNIAAMYLGRNIPPRKTGALPPAHLNGPATSVNLLSDSPT